MRSLRDEAQIGPAAVHTAGGPVGETGAQGVGVGTASRRWKPPVDQGEVRSFLAYLRSCLHREAVHGHVVDAEHLDSDTCACLPAGPELLFSGARDTLPLHHESARVMRLAGRYGQALRYGYPLVVLPGGPEDGPGEPRVTLPLLTVDVRVVDEHEERHVGDRTGVGDALLVRAVGPPDVNTALLALLGITDPEDLFELRTRLRAGAPDVFHRPAAVADLAAKVRTLLTRLEIERVDDIAPLGTRGLPRRLHIGAHNTAVLFRAGPGGQPEVDESRPGSVEGLLADLDPTDRDGLDPDAIGGTALEALLGARPAGGSTDRDHGSTTARPTRSLLRRGAGRRADATRDATPSVVPVSTTALGQPQYRALRAAMHEQLTVVAAPPGGGVHDLVDAMVRTAVTAGQRVLVCGRTEADVEAVLGRADTDPGHPVVRAGGAGGRADEVHLLTRLLGQRSGALPVSLTPDEDDPDRTDDLGAAWARVHDVWNAMDTMASGGHALAHLAEERGRSIALGWDPETLFTPERGGPEYWLHRAERAAARGLGGLSHRAAVRRELGVTTDPDSLARLRAVARLESEWREAVDRRTRCAPLAELTGDLARALDDHRRAAGRRLSTITEPRLWRGRSALENRLETLNWHHGDGRTQLSGLLDTLPAWVCRTDQARALPSRAGLFDLVIVVGAERTRVGELLPVLYRADRAVVVGDPAHPGPLTVLEPEEERRALATAGLTADHLDDRALRHGSGSALCAAYKAAPTMIWLDEQRGAPRALATVASRHCYGDRISVTTEPAPADGPAFDWRDVAGECQAAPGSSYVNREEAYRVAVVVDELDQVLPEGHTMVVVAPLQPQAALVRRLLRQRVLRHRVRVGGPDLLTEGVGTADVTVLSPMLSTGAPAIAERRVRRMTHLWAAVLTRTRGRLVVVGDRSHWSEGDGPLADLLAGAVSTAGVATAADPAGASLVEALRTAGTDVTVGPRIHGWPADLLVRYGARGVVLLLDREPDGAALRRLLARGEALNRSTEELVVIVPAWRCLADPHALVEEILAAC
ncbi:ATP-binding protein [Nocardiopsis sp. MG754419]|uniref:ATP-binding protein n=1 Tax=Nocardiopsis sp. MG754419 TaxID=2259865 RepID=UPI001BA858BD|nr:ATP-binding protein [Nocardiopsis sp. MG754419]MBR8740734.1 DNA helicase [Nocardiopsis sp. MG754419]